MTYENKISDYLSAHGFPNGMVKYYPRKGDSGEFYAAHFPHIRKDVDGQERHLSIAFSKENLDTDFETTMACSCEALKEAVNG